MPNRGKEVIGISGSKSATSHWLYQRITAVFLIPLTIWFVYISSHLLRGGESAIVDSLSDSYSSALFMLYLSVAAYHAMLGMRVVIEDYVHCRYSKIGLLIIINFVTIVSWVFACCAIFAHHVKFL